MTLFLPLHVWDRELDSRLLTAVMASTKGITSVIGNEYTLARLYPSAKFSYLFRAGRPRDNYRSTWNEIIAKNDGFTEIVDEEGNNDLLRVSNSLRESYLPGVTQSSLKWCGKIHYWCDLQKQLMLSSIPENFRNEMQEKMVHKLNSRLEILTSGKIKYFERRSQAIKEFFGEYILIADNYGTKSFGSKKPVDPKLYLGNDSTEERIREIENVAKTLDREAKIFAELIKKIVSDNPNLLFILRPHPVSSISEWNKLLGDHRNLHIIYKDSADPWIMNAKYLIHSGCTTGIQARFARKRALDISSLIKTTETASLSTILSTEIKSYEELVATIQAPNKGNNNSFEARDAYSDAQKAAHHINMEIPANLGFGEAETIKPLINRCKSIHASYKQYNATDDANRMAHMIANQKKPDPLPTNKTSFITAKEIRTRICDAARILKAETPNHYYNELHKCCIIGGSNK